MLTVEIVDFDVDVPQRNASQLTISIIQNSVLVATQSLSKIPLSFLNIQLPPMANDFTVVLRDSYEVLGSINLSAKLFNNVQGMSVYRWLTLFDPQDDFYDGDLREDDYESPRLRFHFSIKENKPQRNESKIQIRNENMTFSGSDDKELQLLKHKVQVLSENRERVQVIKEKHKALILEYDGAKHEWQDEKMQMTVTIQQLQLELTDVLQRLEEGDQIVSKLRDEYQGRLESLQNEAESAQEALRVTFAKREEEISSYKLSLQELQQEQGQSYYTLELEKSRWQNIMSDYNLVKEKYQQSLQDLQNIQKIQSALQQRYEAELVQANSNIQQVSRQLVQLEGQLNHTKLELKSSREEVLSLRDKNTSLESLRASQANETIVDSPPKLNLQGVAMWESSIQQMDQQLQMLNRQLNNERQSQSDLRSQINQLSSQLSESESQRRQLQQELLSDTRSSDMIENFSPMKDSNHQISMLSNEKEILLSKIKTLENSIAMKTEYNLTSQKELQECLAKLQTTGQRLQIQDRLNEQIRQLRQEKLEQAEQLNTLQNQIYKLGEEILNESRDQEFSKLILLKINRLISGSKNSQLVSDQLLEESDRSRDKIQEAPKPRPQEYIPQTSPTRNTQPLKKKQAPIAKMSSIVEEVHEIPENKRDPFSINLPQNLNPTNKETLPDYSFRNGGKQQNSNSSKNSSRSPSPSPDRKRSQLAKVTSTPQPSRTSTSSSRTSNNNQIRSKVIKVPIKSPVKKVMESPPRTVQQNEIKENQKFSSIEQSPGNKRRASTLMNSTQASFSKNTKK